MAKLPVKANDPSIRTTAQELKKHFLTNAKPLVEEYINAALGKGTLSSTNAHAREEVWDVIKQLMLQSSDKLDIPINSAEDVLAAVSTGKCTFEEGEKLLGLYKKMKEINEVGKVGGKEGGGLTINILGSDKPQQIKEIPGEVVEGSGRIVLEVPDEEYEHASS